MRKEIFYWVALFAVVLAVALYIRYFSSPTLSIRVGFSRSAASYGTVYPYQKLVFNVSLNNTGSSEISDMGVDVLLNGNTTYVYGVTIPQGRSTSVSFNYTPSAPGAYNFTVVADGGRLYNLADRQAASSTETIDVADPANGSAYTTLPAGNILSRSSLNMDAAGFFYYSYLDSTYNLSKFKITTMPGLRSFIYPLLEVASPDIVNISSATAEYAGGAAASSIWIRGYVAPQIVGVGAEGLNLTTTYHTANGINVTVVGLKYNESLCSWYSQGWTKVVAVGEGGSCLGIANGSIATLGTALPRSSIASPFGSNTAAAYSAESDNALAYGYASGVLGGTIYFAGITSNSPANSICYGVVTDTNDSSFCSTYLFGTNAIIGPVSLIRTTAVYGDENFSVFSLANTTKVLQQVPINIGIIGSMGASGKSVGFVSGIRNSCTFNFDFGCYNATFSNGTISLYINNTRSSAVTLDSIGCVLNGVPKYTALNTILAAGANTLLSTGCYNDGRISQSLPFGLAFSLPLNYTVGTEHKTVTGSAFVVG